MTDRELDALVAEHVFKLKLIKPQSLWIQEGWFNESNKLIYPMPSLPHYSTNIADAWEVVEKMTKNNLHFKLQQGFNQHTEKPFVTVSFNEYNNGHQWFCYEQESAPKAIVLAALKAMNIEVNQKDGVRGE